MPGPMAVSSHYPVRCQECFRRFLEVLRPIVMFRRLPYALHRPGFPGKFGLFAFAQSPNLASKPALIRSDRRFSVNRQSRYVAIRATYGKPVADPSRQRPRSHRQLR